ncbi:GntR family transcriptional regulator [Naasia sp. SYSU D00057]|uniref:GntR family transcriptional regulator n=1 Tax=Naasia sp. SYSU D00057 TaxID=2817380 RepID=UPI0027DD6C92|nr:GntR family transcriptional regulator [Naasia sp. SYSU D00057]
MGTGSRIERPPARQMLADHVYQALMTSLVEGRLTAGESLNIDALSRELDISQTPIREALARLESTGLVVREALRGYRVAPLFSAEELAELMEARLAIEPQLARLAGEAPGADLVAALQDSNAALARYGQDAGESLASYWQADERFHRLIAEGAHNRFLLSAYSALGGHVQRFRLFGGLGVRDADAAVREHQLIIDAIGASDAEGAFRAMHHHVGLVKHRAIEESTGAARS